MPYTIGNQQVQLADEPKNLNGPVYVPLRQVMEALGGEVTWDHATKTAGARLKGRHARIPTDSSAMTVDGRQVNMSVPAFMEDEQFWVPIEFFGLAFGVPAYADAPTAVRIDTSSLRQAA